MPKPRWMAWKESFDCDPEDGVNEQHLFEPSGSRGMRQTVCTWTFNGRECHTYARIRNLCTDRTDLPKCPKCEEAIK